MLNTSQLEPQLVTDRLADPSQIELPALQLQPSERPAFAFHTARDYAVAIALREGTTRPAFRLLPAGADGVCGFDAVLKRAFDIAFAATFLAVALPIMLLLAVALQLDSPGTLFFVQQRVGHRGRMFGCIKFRTMRKDAAAVLAQLLDECPAARRE